MISIITATFKNEDHILETAFSVLNQTFSNWEWIVVVNGKVDRTAQILDELKDSRINIIQLETNKGVSIARNIGIQSAKGEFICFLDGDDILPKNSLLSRARLFENQEVEFVDGVVHSFVGVTSNVIEKYQPTFRGAPLVRLLSLDGSVFKGNTWMIRKVAGKIYEFKPGLTHGEELLFYAQICNSGLYEFTEEVVLLYRRHDHSAMNNVVGLSQGYYQLLRSLRALEGLNREYILQFRNKAASIVFKSLVKARKPIKAVFYAFKIRFK